jgi:hypothetical protein
MTAGPECGGHSIEQVAGSLEELQMPHHPISWECRVLRGFCLSGRGDYEKAASEFKACIEAIEESHSVNVRLVRLPRGAVTAGASE